MTLLSCKQSVSCQVSTVVATCSYKHSCL